MGGASTRTAIKRMFEACKSCPDNIRSYGICKRGFENYYCRKSKQSHCPRISEKRCGDMPGADTEAAQRREWLCESCRRRVSLPAFSFSRCVRCGRELVCASTPPNKLCGLCASREQRCEHCGALLEGGGLNGTAD